MARFDKKVMQFLNEGPCVANVVEGEVTLYSGRLERNAKRSEFIRSRSVKHDFILFQPRCVLLRRLTSKPE